MSDSVFGFSGKDFVLVAADTATARSIVLLKNDEDKIVKIDSHKVFATSGDAGDRVQFCEFIKKNLDLYYYRNDLTLSTRAVANFTRKELAEALRQSPYNVNLLIAGWDEEEGATLYYSDYLANMSKVPHGAHGYRYVYC
jgi:20S proteasome subunit beta 4